MADDTNTGYAGPPPPRPKRRNAVLRLFDAPLWRDWIVWLAAVWVVAGIGTLLDPPEPQPPAGWGELVMLPLTFALVFGVVPAWIRLQLRRWWWHRRHGSHSGTRNRHGAPGGADVLAEAPRGLGITASDPQLVGLTPEPVDTITRVQFDWSQLDPDSFEYLLTRLLEESGSYEHVRRLMSVNAPDSGLDVEAYRVIRDELTEPRRERVIVQGRHRPKRGVNASDIADLVHAKIPLWEGVPVRGLIVATTGHFTQDAVRWVNDHNDMAKRPDIVLWSRNELTALLTRRPWIAQECGVIQ
ncbi:restriction endonuclease [Saccharopolyspora sp. SCSIO 74807]|uniref:restriction endonuclease n=1 Tax=Saccharopolyspora sp. SCSIO 74807 TaxID=3118084 RepID=UPI0030D5CD1D